MGEGDRRGQSDRQASQEISDRCSELQEAWKHLRQLADARYRACIQRVYTPTYVRMRTCVHTYVLTYVRTCVCTYICTYIHTYVRTYVLTYMCTYLMVGATGLDLRTGS